MQRSKNKKNKNKNKPSAQNQNQAHSHIHSAHCNEHHHQGDLQPPSDPSDIEYDEKGYERHKGIMDDPEEFDHFKNVVSAFFNYKHDSMRDVERMEHNFSFIGSEYQKYMKTNYQERIKKMEECIEKNFVFLCHMVHEQQFLFQFKTQENGNLEIPKLNVSHKDIQKMRSTIRQFVRDWSSQGKKERDENYLPIIEEFKKYFPEPFVDGKRVRVLFPGCGLARLVLDFAAMDYGAQGNEFSYFMLLAANFILNVVDKPEKYEIHPFIHSWCNLFSDADAFETYKVPDVCPSDLIKPGADFSMVAGEFVEVYKDQIAHWESVITCFFIDTANNIIQYIETIYNILKEGGVWINFGPLLYHYADMESEKSIELSWEEVRHVILQMGFEIKMEQVKECTYAMERKTMMEVRYNCVFFTAVKPKKTK